MKALVFGTTGQVAIELGRAAPLVGLTLEQLGRESADLTDPAACAAIVAATDADFIINAAAYTAVDAAETDRDTAQAVNGDAPGAMARAAAARGLPFLHVSTDYVFDGSGARPWREDDPVAPLGIYGATKLDGERQVTAAGGPHVILRTAWVFSAHGKNFVKTMLRLGAERDSLNVVADQIGGPTPAADIAAALVTMARAMAAGQAGGIQHFSGAPDVSRADFARAIMAGAGLSCRIEDIPSSAYPTPARRPLNSRLDCSALRAFGLSRPDWRVGLSDVLKEILS